VHQEPSSSVASDEMHTQQLHCHPYSRNALVEVLDSSVLASTKQDGHTDLLRFKIDNSPWECVDCILLLNVLPPRLPVQLSLVLVWRHFLDKT